MPWSAKAQELFGGNMPPLAHRARALFEKPSSVWIKPRRKTRKLPSSGIACANAPRSPNAFVDSYRRYCWPVQSLDDLKLAPFHLLASEGHVYIDRDHSGIWRLSLSSAPLLRELLLATTNRKVDLVDNEASKEQSIGGPSTPNEVGKAW